MKIDADEKELLESVERGEWKSAGGGERERTRCARHVKATLRKDRRLNIRLSSKDLEDPKAGARGRPAVTDLFGWQRRHRAGTQCVSDTMCKSP